MLSSHPASRLERQRGWDMRSALVASCALAWLAHPAHAETARDIFCRPSVVIATSGSPYSWVRVDAEQATITGHSAAEDGAMEPVPATLNATRKSPGAATAWAIGTTFAGWGMAAGGIAAGNAGLFIVGEAVSAFGPSAGHFYAGESAHGLGMSVIRGVALGAADVIVVLAFEEDWDEGTGEGLFFGSLAVAAGLGLYDWIDAPGAARRANERNGFDLGFAPMAPGRDGRPALGLALVGKF